MRPDFYPDSAMLFAAGLGKRMMPLTLTTPKPLLPVSGKPMIEYALDKLIAYGCKKIVVNTHHLADQVAAYIAAYQQRHPAVLFHLSHEDTLLETGGGLMKSMPLFDTDKPLFVVNGDIIWTDGETPTLERLASAYTPEMDALLLLHPVKGAFGYDGTGDFELSQTGEVMRPPVSKKSLVFTGVHILHPRLLYGCATTPFSLNKIFFARKNDAHILTGIHGIQHTGNWYHIGTPEALKTIELSSY